MPHRISRTTAFACVVVLATVMIAACGSSSSRDRNVQTVVGTSCAKPGQVKKFAKVVHVCGSTSTGKMWFVSAKSTAKSTSCAKPGAVRTKSSRTEVCGIDGKRKSWIAVQPMSSSMTQSVQPETSTTLAPSANTASSTTTAVVSESAGGSSAGADVAATPPTTIVIPNKDVSKAAVALSAPTKAAFVVAPKNAVNGSPMSPAPVIQLVDEAGNPRGREGVVVRIELDRDDVEVAGGQATTDASGRAVFDKLTLTGLAGPVSMIFAPERMAAVKADIELAHGAPVKIQLLGAATSAIAGTMWEPQPTLALVDSAGNVAADEGTEISARLTSGKLLGSAKTAKNGLAVFSLQVARQAATWDIEFSGPDGVDSASTTLDVLPAKASRVSIDTDIPDVATNGVPIADEVAVRVVDEFGNTVKAEGTKVEMDVIPNTIRLGQQTLPRAKVINRQATIGADGIARFSKPTIEGELTTWALRVATVEEDFVEAFAPVELVAGPAVALERVSGPAGARSGVPLLQQPSFRLVDKSGNAIAGKGTVVTASVDSGYSVTGASATTADDGVATFTNLAIEGVAGVVKLSFTVPLVTGVESSLTLTAGEIANLAITSHTLNAVAGVKFSVDTKLTTLDKWSNVVSESVSVLGQCGGSGIWTGVQTDTGVATFSGFVVGRAGTAMCDYQMTTGKTWFTAHQAVSVVAGDAATVEILTQPPQSASIGSSLSVAPRIRVVDAYGNPVEKAGLNVGVSTSNSSLIIANSTTKTDSSGIAEFKATSFGGVAGTYRLSFGVAGGQTVTAANDTVVAPGPAARADLTRDLGGIASGVKATVQPILTLTDMYGNIVKESGWTATMSLRPIDNGADAIAKLSLTGNSVSSGTNGVIQFSALTVSGVSGVTYVPTFSISKSAANLTDVRGGQIVLSPGIATSFTSSIVSSVGSGGALGSITQTDAKGNVVSTAGRQTVDATWMGDSSNTWVSQREPDVTVNAVTTFGLKIFGVSGATGKLRVTLGTQPSRDFAIVLSSTSVAGDPAPSGGVILSVASTSPRFVEIAPKNWYNGSFPVGSFQYAQSQGSNAWVGSTSGFTLPTKVQLTAMTRMSSAVLSAYSYYSFAKVWSSTALGSSQWVWDIETNTMTTIPNNYSAIVLPVRSFG